MRKLIVLLVAVSLALFAVNANAGNLTVANTDLTLAGGVSASYNYRSDTNPNAAGDDHDYFQLDTAIIHLLKTPTVDSPVGGNLAIGSFEVKLVDGTDLTPRVGGENTRIWLGHFSYMPVENLTVDAGLLWHKFGEAPITILNAHVTRPIAFLAQPIAFAGARVGYDAGIAQVYVGTNDGSVLDSNPLHGNHDGVNRRGEVLESDRAYEVGACAKIAETLSVAVNYFDHDEGYNTVNGSVGVDVGLFSAKVEVNYVTTDTYLGAATKNLDDDAISWLVYLGVKVTDNFKIPLRVEFVDDMDSGIYAGYDGYSIALTPTFNPTPNSFIRLEGVYMEDNNDRTATKNDKKFADSRGVPGKRDDRHAVIAEFGFLF